VKRAGEEFLPEQPRIDNFSERDDLTAVEVSYARKTQRRMALVVGKRISLLPSLSTLGTNVAESAFGDLHKKSVQQFQGSVLPQLEMEEAFVR
jgi:hypothetical protein